MFYIVLLIFFGLLFLVAELVLLPGVSIGAILALVCYGSSIYLAFRDLGPVAGSVVVLVILVLSLIAHRRFAARQDVAALLAQTENQFVEHAYPARTGAERRRPRHDPLAPFADGQDRGERTDL